MISRRIRRWALAAALFVLPAPAVAQNVFTTPNGATTVGTVLMCLNSGGLAIPANQTNACPFGGGGGGSTFGAAFPTTGTAAGVSDGTNMVGMRASSAVLADAFTPPTAGLLQTAGFQSWYNGTTWDRARGDATNGLWTNIKSSVSLNVVCTSGCAGSGGGGGTSSLFGTGFPAAGTAIGISDGTNMLAARGDNTNGLWANIKASIAIPVTGTFFQATQPVSGTFWQTTQPVSGTFWQTTQPISAAALPLPAGAATESTLGSILAAVQLGSATTGTAVPGAALFGGVNVGGNLLGVTGLSLNSGAVHAQQIAIVDASGAQITNFGSSAAVGATGSAVPASASLGGLNVAGNMRASTGLAVGSTFSQTVAIVDASGNQITSFGAPTTNITQIASTAVAAGAGTTTAGTLRTVTATDSPEIPLLTNILAAAQAGAQLTGNAVPNSAIYMGIRVGTTNIQGASGIATGALNSVAAAIVKADGTQFTDFATQTTLAALLAAAQTGVQTTGSTVPTSAIYVGMNVSGVIQAPTAIVAGSTIAQTVAIVDASGNQLTSFGGNISQWGGVATTLGQKASAASLPVVLPTDPDIRPSTGNITAQDVASASTTGQNGATIVTGSPTAASFQTQAVNGSSTARILITGTWTGTLEFDGSLDSGTTWTPIPARVVGSVYTQSSVTGNGQFDTDIAGLTNVRVRATAAWTGTATIRYTFTAAPGPIQVLNPIRIVDGASGQQAVIKPASTAPVAADPALTVAVSPNGSAVGADGSTAPANTVLMGAKTGANVASLRVCTSRKFVHVTSNTDTQILTASGSNNIYICDYSFSFSGAGAFFLEKSSTGTCGSPTQIDMLWSGGASVAKTDAKAVYTGLNTGASQQLCINTTLLSSSSLDIAVNYDQSP